MKPTSTVLIDQLLLEMPRFIDPNAPKIRSRVPVNDELPEIEKFLVGFDVNLRNFNQIMVKAEGIQNPNRVVINLREPVTVSDTDLSFKIPLSRDLESEYATEIHTAIQKIYANHRRVVNRRRLSRRYDVETDPSKIPTIEIATNPGSLMTQKSFNEKFRWATAGGESASGGADSLLLLIQQQKEGDRIFRVVQKSGDKIKRRVYVLLNPEEEAEFRRMLISRARRKIDRAMGESLLMEMPRYILKRGEDERPFLEKAKIEHVKTFLQSTAEDEVSLVHIVKATLRSGDTESFYGYETLTNEEWVHISRLTKDELQELHDFRPKIAAVSKALAKAKDWISENDSDLSIIDGLEEIQVRGGNLSLIRDLRYVSLENTHNIYDTLVQFSRLAKPTDTIVKVVFIDRHDVENVHHVILSPEERILLDRRIRSFNRDKVASVLSQGTEDRNQD